MKHIFKLLTILLIGNAAAQNLPDYIPGNAQFVFSMNLQQLSAKSNQMDYTRYLSPLIREGMGYYNGNASCEIISVKDIIKSPGEYGLGNQLYVYKTSSEGLSGTIILFGLSDARKFESKLNTACMDGKQVMLRTLENGKVYAGNTTSLSFNKQMAVLFIKAYNYYDYYDSDYSYPATIETVTEYDSATVEAIPTDTTMVVEQVPVVEEVVEAPVETYIEDSAMIRDREDRARRKLEETADFMEKCLQPSKDNYTSNRNFYKLVEGHHDAFFYFNSLDMVYNRLYFPFNRGHYGIEKNPDNRNRFFLSEMNSTYTLDFENGRAVMNILSNYNKNVYPYIAKAYDARQSKKLFKYIDGRTLLGYMSFAVDAEAMAKFYWDFYKEVFEAYTEKKSAMSTEYRNILQASELLYSLLDKEMLYNSFKPQVIFACTGFEDVKVSYTTYEYDENFNQKEKTVEKTEKIPRMVLVSATGNKENAKKLFDIISGFSVFTKINDRVFAFTGYRKNAFQPLFCHYR